MDQIINSNDNRGKSKLSNTLGSIQTDVLSIKQDRDSPGLRSHDKSRTTYQNVANPDLVLIDGIMALGAIGNADIQRRSRYSGRNSSLKRGYPMPNDSKEFPGDHSRTNTLNLEFEGNNNKYNQSFVIKTGSDRQEILRLLSAKSGKSRTRAQTRNQTIDY